MNTYNQSWEGIFILNNNGRHIQNCWHQQRNEYMYNQSWEAIFNFNNKHRRKINKEMRSYSQSWQEVFSFNNNGQHIIQNVIQNLHKQTLKCEH